MLNRQTFYAMLMLVCICSNVPLTCVKPPVFQKILALARALFTEKKETMRKMLSIVSKNKTTNNSKDKTKPSGDCNPGY